MITYNPTGYTQSPNDYKFYKDLVGSMGFASAGVALAPLQRSNGFTVAGLQSLSIDIGNSFQAVSYGSIVLADIHSLYHGSLAITLRGNTFSTNFQYQLYAVTVVNGVLIQYIIDEDTITAMPTRAITFSFPSFMFTHLGLLINVDAGNSMRVNFHFGGLKVAF